MGLHTATSNRRISSFFPVLHYAWQILEFRDLPFGPSMLPAQAPLATWHPNRQWENHLFDPMFSRWVYSTTACSRDTSPNTLSPGHPRITPDYDARLTLSLSPSFASPWSSRRAAASGMAAFSIGHTLRLGRGFFTEFQETASTSTLHDKKK